MDSGTQTPLSTLLAISSPPSFLLVSSEALRSRSAKRCCSTWSSALALCMSNPSASFSARVLMLEQNLPNRCSAPHLHLPHCPKPGSDLALSFVLHLVRSGSQRRHLLLLRAYAEGSRAARPARIPRIIGLSLRLPWLQGYLWTRGFCRHCRQLNKLYHQQWLHAEAARHLPCRGAGSTKGFWSAWFPPQSFQALL